MKERVRITDVSPRDGLQNEPGIIPTADKVRLIELLCATGVDEIEVTSFVSPKWVPQLGDAAEVLRGLSSSPLPEGGGWGVGGEDTPSQRWRPPARQALSMERAKAVRHAATEPEKALWSLLRKKEFIGAKFRRQHPFGPYILDFFCQEKLLAIEIDGITHASHTARIYDAQRDAWVAEQGVRTLRFSQEQVIRHAESVALAIRDAVQATPPMGTRRPTPQPPPSGRGLRQPIVFSALVPNERGFQDLLNANGASQRTLISKASLFTAASETFSHKNTNATIAETLQRFNPVIRSAHAEGLSVRAYISCVIACPFEGAIAPDVVVDVARRLINLDVDELDLGDTIGAGTPQTISALLNELDRHIPILGGHTPITLHLHDTFGRAADCVKTALDLGVRSFDGSVAGLGGCPYASKKLPDGSIQRAPGNISTELLVRTIHDAGYETGVDLEKLAFAADFAREIVARSRSTT